jgi:hypothetical protein
MLIRKVLVLILGVFIATSCQNEEENCLKEQVYYGEWEWFQSVGMYLDTMTTMSGGSSRTLFFSENEFREVYIYEESERVIHAVDYCLDPFYNFDSTKVNHTLRMEIGPADRLFHEEVYYLDLEGDTLMVIAANISHSNIDFFVKRK